MNTPEINKEESQMEFIDVGKLEEFIKESQKKHMTNQEITNDVLRLKHSILEQTSKYLTDALEKQKPAMVAAIAEILKTY